MAKQQTCIEYTLPLPCGMSPEVIEETTQRARQLESAARTLRKQLRDGKRLENVRVREEWDFQARKIRLRRTDTGELLPRLERDMSDADRNLDLFRPDNESSSDPDSSLTNG